MIMVSDITNNNYTRQASPVWSNADNFAALMSQQPAQKSAFFKKLTDRLKSAR